MVYHLRHAEFIRDLMCFDFRTAKDLIEQARRNVDMNINPDMLIKVMTECSCARSREGYEACLNMHREEFLPGHHLVSDPLFEKILEELDKKFFLIREDWAELHVL